MSKRKRNTVIEEFIEIYKSEPCLWRVKSKEYHDRPKRCVAYSKLVKKLKELEPDADKDAVVKKINNLRSSVRKEKKKYEASVRSATSADDIYKPTLWYYYLFDFMGSQDIPRGSNSNIKEEESDCEDNYANDEESVSNAIERSSVNNTNSELQNKDQSIQNAEQRLVRQKDGQNKNHFKPSPLQDDRYDLLGKTIAIKLRGMEKRQRLIAEKKINDILFECEIGYLTTHSASMQHQDTFPIYSPSSTFVSSPSSS